MNMPANARYCDHCERLFFPPGELRSCPSCGDPVRHPNARPHKYGAAATEVDGIRFASKREAQRWGELKMMEVAGHISELKRQVPYEIVVYGHRICKYVADFVYVDASGLVVVEDVKGVKTPLYRLKKRLMLACFGICLKET